MRLAVVIVLVGMLALLAGCGGGGGGEGSEATGASAAATTTLSPEEFVERANGGCERGRGGVLRRAYNFLRAQRAGGRPAAEIYAEMIKAVLLPAVEREMEWIRKLEVPPAQRKPIAALFAANRVAIREVSRLKRIASMATVEPYFAHASKLARADGLTACANSRRGIG